MGWGVRTRRGSIHRGLVQASDTSPNKIAGAFARKEQARVKSCSRPVRDRESEPTEAWGPFNYAVRDITLEGENKRAR